MTLSQFRHMGLLYAKVADIQHLSIQRWLCCQCSFRNQDLKNKRITCKAPELFVIPFTSSLNPFSPKPISPWYNVNTCGTGSPHSKVSSEYLLIWYGVTIIKNFINVDPNIPWRWWGVLEVGEAPGSETGSSSEIWYCQEWRSQGQSVSVCPWTNPVSCREASGKSETLKLIQQCIINLAYTWKSGLSLSLETSSWRLCWR